MVDFKIVTGRQDHVNQMKGKLRKIDEFECYANIDKTGDFALQFSYNVSSIGLVWTAFMDNEPFAMFGASNVEAKAGVGIPWLLATDKLEEAWLFVLRQSKKYVARMQERYGLLFNFVHAENTKSIKWLKWAGFVIMEAKPYGAHGHLFHQFYKKREGFYV